MEIHEIAVIRTDFREKFGVPRQSGLVEGLIGRIEFLPEYSNADAVRGLEEFKYIWVIWGFDGTTPDTFKATVRPPRLGGNEHVGVFATRSPFRPNGLGLSSLKLEKIEYTQSGPVLIVSGIDMVDGTKIYDIKPYLEYVDSHSGAGEGFASKNKEKYLNIDTSSDILCKVEQKTWELIRRVLAEDPRPHYHEDPQREYGLSFGEYNIRFKVDGDCLTVIDITKINAV